MTLPSSDIPVPAAMASEQASRHRRFLARLSGGFAIVAVVTGLGWGPVMLIIALLLRPPQLGSGTGDIVSLQQEAETRMWIILIASFLAILALMAVAVVLGRRALRFAESGPGSGDIVARLRTWGGICLAVCLIGLGCLGLMGGFWAIAKRPPFPIHNYTSIPWMYSQWIFIVPIGTTILGAMGNLILNGIAVRETSARTRGVVVVSALVMLLWFLFIAGAAQFLVSFYLNLHFIW